MPNVKQGLCKKVPLALPKVFGWSSGTEKETQWSLMNIY